MKDGRKKGQRYMVGISKALSTWVCATPPGTKSAHLPFRPRSTIITPIEGHWAGKGDILHRPDVYFPFSVECKNSERGKIDALFETPTWEVWKWWEQAKRQADDSEEKLLPLLIFSRNLRKNYVLLGEAVYQWMLQRQQPTGLVARLWRPGDGPTVLTTLDELTSRPAVMPTGRVLSVLRRNSQGGGWPKS